MAALGVGLDEAWDRLTVPELQAYRATFVCRYLGEDNTGKNLSRAEADALIAGGIAVVSNYEYNPGSALKGYAEGQRVARLADAQHQACGGPGDRPIYFSVDVNVTTAGEFAAVRDYFAGIASVIGVGRTGAYAEYDVIRDLFDRGLIRWGWQTYAWSGSPTQWDPRAQARQVANGIYVAGHNVDRDENQAIDFGQWPFRGDDMLRDETIAGTSSPNMGDRNAAILIADIWNVIMKGQSQGGGMWGNSPFVTLLTAAAADEARDAATLAAIQALAGVIQAGGGSVETVAIVGAINAAADRVHADVTARFDRLTAAAQAEAQALKG